MFNGTARTSALPEAQDLLKVRGRWISLKPGLGVDRVTLLSFYRLQRLRKCTISPTILIANNTNEERGQEERGQSHFTSSLLSRGEPIGENDSDPFSP